MRKEGRTEGRGVKEVLRRERKYKILMNTASPLSFFLCDNCCMNSMEKLIVWIRHWVNFPKAFFLPNYESGFHSSKEWHRLSFMSPRLHPEDPLSKSILLTGGDSNR